MNEYRPVGLFVVENDKGQYIYSDPFIKGGYMIPKTYYKEFRTYAMRYVIGIVVGTLISMFINKAIPSVAAGLATAIVGEILFRVKFLPKKCTFMPDYKSNSNFLDVITTSSTRSKKLIKGFLLIAIGVLIILNAYSEKFVGAMFYASWVVGILALLASILFFISFAKDGGNK